MAKFIKSINAGLTKATVQYHVYLYTVYESVDSLFIATLLKLN